VSGPAAAASSAARTFLKCRGGQAGRVVLLERQVAERGGQKPAVVEFRDPALGAGEVHRLRRVEHDGDPGVGLLLIELDVELVGLRDLLPVDVLELVGLRVGAMIRVFDA
jgi:hypothetical protein